MKKILFTLLLLFCYMTNVNAVQDQKYFTCIYKSDDYTLDVQYYYLTSTSINRIKFIDKEKVIFDYEYDLVNDITEYYKNFNKNPFKNINEEIPFAYKYINSNMTKYYSNSNPGEMNPDHICPQKMYVLKNYEVYACEYEGETMDSCSWTLNEIKNMFSESNSLLIRSMNFYTQINTSSSVNNMDVNDNTFQLTFNDIQDNIEKYCDKQNNPDAYNEEECEKAKIQSNAVADQSNNLSITKEQLATNYEKYKLYQSEKEFTAGDCNTILGDIKNENAPAYYLNFAFNLIKYIAIVLLLVLTTVDFAKASASSDNDALKKALKKAVKRLIICVIIFFLPTFINFVLRLFGLVDGATCGIGG